MTAPTLRVIEDEMRLYFKSKHADKLEYILGEKCVISHYSVVVDFFEFFRKCPSMTSRLWNFPGETFALAERAIKTVMREIKEDPINCGKKYSLKQNIHFRVAADSIYSPEDFYYDKFPCWGLVQGKYIGLECTVSSVSPILNVEQRRFYTCKECRYTRPHNAHAARDYVHPMVLEGRCPTMSCPGTKALLHKQKYEFDESELMRYQVIKVSERSESARRNTITVHIEHDLVDFEFALGDEVKLSGFVFRHVPRGKFVKGSNDIMEPRFLANHALLLREKHNISELQIKQFEEYWMTHDKDQITGRTNILKSFCPEIKGLYLVKSAILSVLAGGTENAPGKRCNSHLLLVGDPGTAKTRILRYAADMINGSVKVVALGITEAGLTASAEKGGNEDLTPGALPRSNGSIFYLDEINLLSNTLQQCLFEPMEEQTVTVHKAKQKNTFPAAFTMLASSNFNGKYGAVPENDLMTNTGLESPLLSRFDVILFMDDSSCIDSEINDDEVARFILSEAQLGTSESLPKQNPNSEEFQGQNWTHGQIKSYINWIRKVDVKMPDEVESILKAYYEKCRMLSSSSCPQTTSGRLMWSLLRISEGHAKLMHHKEVQVLDAVYAIEIFESSIQLNGYDREKHNVLYRDFPKDPQRHYYSLAERILKELKLDYVWEMEKERLGPVLVQQDRESMTSRQEMVIGGGEQLGPFILDERDTEDIRCSFCIDMGDQRGENCNHSQR